MRYVYPFDHKHDLTSSEIASLVGGKAMNLGVMVSELNLPVPPGFVISTAACLEFLDQGWPAGLDDEIREHVSLVEKAVGRHFGDASNPLLVSVRSGAPVSMPGMMDTILNLGLNADIAQGLMATSGNNDFVSGSHRRFLEMYQSIVGDDAPDDPWLQLKGAIEAVFSSWTCDRAQSYRDRENIPDDLGTAVVVQTMVFGNLGEDSGTGVVFTRNPATGHPDLYGDVMFNAQGEDVVAGTHETQPISVLDDSMPQVADELNKISTLLERHYADLCDIEFTIEKGRLWMLQTRVGKRSAQAALKIAIDMAEDEDFPLSRLEAVERVSSYLDDPPRTATERGDAPVIATGLGASPGIATGAIVTTPEAAVTAAEAGETVLLVRRETSPNDVHGMAKAAGILTATGGLASHAAVVARGWDIPAVVGATAVEIDGDTVVVGGRRYEEGEILSIDGATGEVFHGVLSSSGEVVEEALTLLEWAEELGVLSAQESAPGAETEAIDAEDVALTSSTSNDVLRALFVKGFSTPEELANALFADPEGVQSIFEELEAAKLIESIGGMFQMSDAGKASALGLIISDRETWGGDNADRALDGLIPLDQRMKEIVTRWQMREFNGQQIINDHSDQEHDGAVISDFEEFHEDASVWLGAQVATLPRLGVYSARLIRASRMMAEGDNMYLASPRVDSYHSVWFELHEDLIHLAGRTREDEVDAGRA